MTATKLIPLLLLVSACVLFAIYKIIVGIKEAKKNNEQNDLFI